MYLKNLTSKSLTIKPTIKLKDYFIVYQFNWREMPQGENVSLQF